MDKFEEFIDKKFWRLIVVKYVGNTPFNSPLFECKCECGNTTYATSTQLRNGKKKSCGCLKKEHRYEYKKQIAGLEAKLAESEKDRLMWQEMYKSADKQNKEICETDIYPLQEQIQQLKQQLAEHSKYHEWVSEFLERYKIDQESTPEYSENPMIEYCEQVYDFRLCDNVEIKDLQEQLADYKKDNEQLEDRLHTAEQETLHFQNKYFDMQHQLAEKDEQIKDLTECNQYLQIYRNQDKISLAVERLENVKDLVKEKESWEIEGSDYSIVYADDILDQIDKQIEELKKENR